MIQSELPALGPLLRAHRHDAGLTLEELAEGSGVSARAIGDMERGHSRGPQARTVQALAAALGLTPAATEELLDAARAGRRRQQAVAAPGLCDLPPSVTDFTGRETETAWLGRSITAPAGPPVSIVSGAPGLGKTALVVHAGTQLVGRFADGCFFVDLRGLDAEPVAPHDALARLLRALGVRERDLPAETDERRVLYRRLMREREALVVLDNAAHEAQVRALLPGPGSSRLWVTSRRTLAGIEHARRLVLAPLPVCAATELLAAILAQREDDAAGADGSAAPDGSGPAALARIAELCGHLPLALRIAGNRLLSRPAWSARGLAERLGDEDLRLQRLTAGDLRIRSAFRLSYEQLSEPVRRLFRRLALVPGPDFGPGAGAALTGLGPDLVEEMLDELLDLGLLGHTTTDRLLFHDLLRLYARERLLEEESSQDRAAAEAALHRWLLDTAAAAGQWFQPGPSPPDGAATDGETPAGGFGSARAAQAWLETESVNWLAALRVAAAAGRHGEVVRTAESMHWFSDRWTNWGHWPTVFGLSRTAAHALGDDVLTATHANYLAWAVHYCSHQPRESSAIAEQAAELARRGGDVTQEAWAHFYAAAAAVQLGGLDEAVRRARRAAALFATAGDREGHPQALLALASAQADTGSHRDAVATTDAILGLLADPATAPAAHIGDFTRTNALAQQGKALLALGRPREAEQVYTEARLVGARVEVPLLQAIAALGQAQALAELGERERALGAAREAREFAETAGDPARLAEATALLTALADVEN
ncbi:helix-turn-helix domain-containing protein [Kitasatospora sp. NPDC049258]|uniref:helix-turn-helix domain-containing protein n=1 Tax=Kitasatospora sp. NPDC049258 TaxID=3155394 RepID=UPI0034354D22